MSKICVVSEYPLQSDSLVYFCRATRRLGIDYRDPNLIIRHNLQSGGALPQADVYVPFGPVDKERGAVASVLHQVTGTEYSGKLNDWHGYVVGDGPFVVPTFHPRFVLLGNHKLFSAFLFDMKRAMEVAAFGIKRDTYELIVDPDVQWFAEFVEQATSDLDSWMAVDIETPMKSDDEDDTLHMLHGITRINFSVNPKQGITVPWENKYRFGINRLLKHACPKVFWNERFDVPILTAAGEAPAGTVLDGMWAWHMLQSDLPKGLGFVTPFYSTLPPWKHLSLTDPGKYAAQDAVAQLINMMGIAKQLQQYRQWEAFIRYAVLLDERVLHPAESQGILLDKTGLAELQSELQHDLSKVEARITNLVPPAVRPWGGGWKRQPNMDIYPNAVLRKVRENVLVCTSCSATEVGPAHKCKVTK
jgi:hypothetical protein